MRDSRTRLLIGDEGIERLRRAHVAVFGLGGVGSYALEAIARAGVGHLYLVDSDALEESNLNRQLLALESTLGRPKVDVARERVLQINPKAQVEVRQGFVDPDNVDDFLPDSVEYAIDAIDSLASKTALLAVLHKRGIPFVSAMGAAGKLSPTGLKVADIGKTTHCPLAKRIRKELRALGIHSGVRCVYSEETAISPLHDGERRPGTISYLPGLVGLTTAGVIINDIIGHNPHD